MRALALSPTHRFAGISPLVIRVIVGTIIAAHGWQKLAGGPAAFGGFLEQLGVPFPTLMAYVVTFLELVGGILLVLGLLSRWAGLLLAAEMVVTTLLVKVDVGLIAASGQGAGAELDLALLAGFLAILFLGPGKVSLDYMLGIERERSVEMPTMRPPEGSATA